MFLRERANLLRLHTVQFQLSDILGKEKLMEKVKRSVVARACGEGDSNRQSTEDF